MRSISLILAAAVILATSSLAGSADRLPGAGTFAIDTAPSAVMVAAR